jgi:hypothetical protein
VCESVLHHDQILAPQAVIASVTCSDLDVLGAEARRENVEVQPAELEGAGNRNDTQNRQRDAALHPCHGQPDSRLGKAVVAVGVSYGGAIADGMVMVLWARRRSKDGRKLARHHSKPQKYRCGKTRKCSAPRFRGRTHG